MDCTFVPKNGSKTYGLDCFWNGSADRSEKGLELSVIAVVDADRRTAYTLSAMQTPGSDSENIRKMRRTARKSKHREFNDVSVWRKNRNETRIDFYLAHLRRTRNSFPEDVRCLVVDGYYIKEKFVTGAVNEDIHVIGKLRSDANLRYLYNGSQKKRGRPRKYDAKVDFQDISRMQFVGEVSEGILLYTEIVNSVALKRDIRIAYLLDTRNKKKIRYAILFSTDTGTAAGDIVRFYKARFQIEFIFRDAKQFAGLCDCRTTEKESLNFHFNASLSALNLAKAEARRPQSDEEPAVFSMASHKIRYFNEFLIDKFISMSGLDPNLIKNTPDYEKLRNYGAINA